MSAFKTVLGAALALAIPAAAQPPVHFTAEATTDVPLMIGARAHVEHIPTRIRVSSSVGYLPKPYVELINDIVVEGGGYDRKTADLIETSLTDSLVWRVDLGWRPFASYGLYVDLGYRYLGLGGALTSAVALEQATGYAIPPEIAEAGVDVDFQLYTLETNVHMFNAELGWEWLIGEHFNLRAALGWVSTVAAKSKVESSFDIPGADIGGVDIPGMGSVSNPLAEIDKVERDTEDYLNKNLEENVHAPVFTLSAGWRFF